MGVEIPRMKAGIRMSREVLSQVPKFTLHRREMSSADDSDKEAEGMAQRQRAGLTVGGKSSAHVTTRCPCLQH